VHLPLQTVLDVQFFEEPHHVRVGSEEYVQSGFYPVAVFVLPGRHLPSQHIACFENCGMVTGVYEILSAG
jgi:hypothetical protein